MSSGKMKVYFLYLASVESVPAGDVVQEERDEEDTCMDRMGMVTVLPSPCLSIIISSFSSIVQFGHQVDVCVSVEGGQEDVED